MKPHFDDDPQSLISSSSSSDYLLPSFTFHWCSESQFSSFIKKTTLEVFYHRHFFLFEATFVENLTTIPNLWSLPRLPPKLRRCPIPLNDLLRKNRLLIHYLWSLCCSPPISGSTSLTAVKDQPGFNGEICNFAFHLLSCTTVFTTLISFQSY